jgi:hypothetical protein
MSGAAFQMRWRLQRLMREHNVECDPVSIPLAPQTDHAMILDGYASTSDLDLDRVQLRSFAFGYPLLKNLPPLYLKHDAYARCR